MSDMTVESYEASSAEFRVGSVISKSFSLFFGKFFYLIPIGIIGALPYLFIDPGATTRPVPGQAAALALATVSRGFLLGALVGFLKLLCSGMLVHASFQAIRGAPIQVGETIKIGLARFFPILGAGICVGLAVMAGSILLIVPGMIFLTMYWVTIPVTVVERLGPIRSMKRSAQLSKGSRWQLFGLFVLLVIVIGIPNGLIQFGAIEAHNVLAARIITFVWQAVVAIFSGLIPVIAYHDLRVAKEGVDTDRIAAVFD